MTFKPADSSRKSSKTLLNNNSKVNMLQEKIDNMELILSECLNGMHEVLTVIKAKNSPSLQKIAFLIS